MRRIAALILALLAAGPAFAADTPSQSVMIAPYPLRGQAAITVGATSGAVNAAMSLAPNSPAFNATTHNGPLTIKVQGTATAGIYVCWLGGTCTSSLGEYVAPGESVTRSVHPAVNAVPSAISTASTTVVVEW